MELAKGQPNRFAGLGLMLREPGYQLVFSRTRQASTVTNLTPEHRTKIDVSVRHAVTSLKLESPAAELHISASELLPLHSGLGAGTQLSAATAVGVKLLHCPQDSPQADSFDLAHLAKISGRGLRSSVGLQGFLTGGIVIDRGMESHQTNASRTFACDSASLPAPWRVVLTTPIGGRPVQGKVEIELMQRLSTKANPDREQMLQTANRIVEAAQQADFATFTTGLEHYMIMAAKLFEPAQGGMYNGAAITEAAEPSRASGLSAVGQSSWGPTLFGFAQSLADAQRSCDQIAILSKNKLTTRICRPADRGAMWHWQAAD